MDLLADTLTNADEVNMDFQKGSNAVVPMIPLGLCPV